MDINPLINSITPLYNSYKQNSAVLSGVESLSIMWDIGDILKNFINQNDIAPHKLYRIVYGKSDGSENISQKSWVTREFQGRCYRIRNIFVDKEDISKKLYNLKRFTAFREAMPFFDNKKYKLRGKEMDSLLNLLNSDLDNKRMLDEIHTLQNKKIGIKNPRNQKDKELDFEKKVFINMYNYIYGTLNKSDEEVISILNHDKVNYDLIKYLIANTNSLTQDGLKFADTTEIENRKIENDIWREYRDVIIDFKSHTNALKVRRFRKLIGPERIAKLADMLYLVSKKNK